jgi:hypothetical protein
MVSPYTQIYYAPVSSTGIGSWTYSTSSYPILFGSASCSIYNNYIYCVGDSWSGLMQDVYYAPILNPGVGPWTATSNYPVYASGTLCAASYSLSSSGYIYCVGSGQTAPNNQVYYAYASNTGLGNWVATSNYPIQITSSSCQIPGSGGSYLGGGGPTTPVSVTTSTSTTSTSTTTIVGVVYSMVTGYGAVDDLNYSPAAHAMYVASSGPYISVIGDVANVPKLIGQYSSCTGCDVVLYDPPTNDEWATDDLADNIFVFSPAGSGNTVLYKIPTAGGTTVATYDYTNNVMYVEDSVNVIDMFSGNTLNSPTGPQSWPTNALGAPNTCYPGGFSSLAYQPTTGYVYSTDFYDNTGLMCVFTGVSNGILGSNFAGTWGYGTGPFGYDPVSGQMFTAAPADGVLGFQGDGLYSIYSWPGMAGSTGTPAYDSNDGYMYVPEYLSNTVLEYSAANGAVADISVGPFSTLGNVQAVAYSPRTHYIYAITMTSATTNGFIVEISGNSVVSTMQIGVVGWEPVLLAYDPNDGYMYALNDDGAGTVSIVET